MVSAFKKHVKELQERRLTEQREFQWDCDKSDNGIPLVSFLLSIRDAQLAREIAAAQCFAATGKVNLLIAGLVQVQANHRSNPFGKDRVVGARIEQSVQ